VARNRFRIDVSQHPRFTTSEVSQWVDCLKDNVSQFNFSGRLDTPEKRLVFLLKNGADHKNINSQETGYLSRYFREKNWPKLVEILEPTFDLLNTATILSLNQVRTAYANLDKDQQKLLDEMVTWAFLRKTSKLGMTFAKQQGMPVLFAWKIPDTDDDLATMRNILDAKTFRYQPPAARELGTTGRITLEAITLSEMRKYGSLQKMMLAPEGLLIVGISEDTTPQEASSSIAAAGGGKLPFGNF